MEKHRTITTLKGDVFGAVSAATINLPMAIGYGITGFFALGNDFIPQAVILGVSATIFSCLFTALFSGTPTLISGPSGPLTIVLISIVAKLQNTIAPFTQLQNHYAFVIGSAALCLIIGGLLQSLLGFFRIGSLVKYVPYPVISGFVNGLSGVIVAIGFSLFDLSEFFLFRAALRSKRLNRDIALNLLINLTVIVLTVAVDLTLAIIVGILITTASFVVKTGKSVVRRKYRCNQVRSKRVRNMEQTRLIKIVESRLVLENYMSGDVIIREGDRDRDLFMLARGMVSVKMQLQNE